MKTKRITHRCLVATNIVSSLGATFGCFASESNPAERLTTSTDVTGNIPSFVQVVGGENASVTHNKASMRTRNVKIAAIEVDVDPCDTPFGQPSPCSAFPSVFVQVANVRVWAD